MTSRTVKPDLASCFRNCTFRDRSQCGSSGRMMGRRVPEYESSLFIHLSLESEIAGSFRVVWGYSRWVQSIRSLLPRRSTGTRGVAVVGGPTDGDQRSPLS